MNTQSNPRIPTINPNLHTSEDNRHVDRITVKISFGMAIKKAAACLSKRWKGGAMIFMCL